MNSLPLRRRLAGGSPRLLALLLAGVFSLPLLWLALAAFQPADRIYRGDFTWQFNQFTTRNLTEAWALLGFERLLLNSTLVASLSTLGAVLSSALVGYAFALLPARGKPLWFALLLTTIMLPPVVTLAPSFVLFSRLDWVDTYLPLIVPHWFANAFYVFLFRQFFRSLPLELFESAELEGSNPWHSFWRIGFPLARPAAAAVVVFAFAASWNDFLAPLVYLNSPDLSTVSLGLAVFQGIYLTQFHYLMPLTLLSLLPVALIFILAQRLVLVGLAGGDPYK